MVRGEAWLAISWANSSVPPFQVGGDTGSSEGVVADLLDDAGLDGSPPHHSIGVVATEALGAQLTRKNRNTNGPAIGFSAEAACAEVCG